MTAKKCTKKRDARAELWFCLLDLAFLPFSLPLLSSDLKVPPLNPSEEGGSGTSFVQVNKHGFRRS